MRIQKHWAAVVFVLLLACGKSGKNDNPGPGNPPQKGKVYPHGTPVGGVIKSTIGAAGGTLTSEDGALTVEIPAGALEANTEISVQEITSTVPGSAGPAYRLLPEGVIFKKPVNLTYTYNERQADTLLPEAMYLYCQGKDGIWKMMTQTRLNKSNRTISVSTSHFSDWSAAVNIRLIPSKTEIMTGETVEFSIEVTGINSSPDIIEAAVEIQTRIDDRAYFKDWRMNGEGELTDLGARAVYKAPADISSPLMDVEVGVEITLPDYIFLPRTGDRKITVWTVIYVKKDIETYFFGTINGVEFEGVEHHAKEWPGADKFWSVHARIKGSPNKTINMIKGNETVPALPKTYRWYKAPGPNEAEDKSTMNAVYSGEGGVTGTFYKVCDAEGDLIKYIASQGAFEMRKREKIGNDVYVEGSAEVFLFDGKLACNDSKVVHHIVCHFRVKVEPPY